MPKPASCFLHIEKSGGSTVVRRLRDALGADSVFHAHEGRALQAPLDLMLTRHPVVAGHFSFADMTDAILARTFLFTVLRDPIDRVVSLYHFWRQSDRTRQQGVVSARRRDLADIASEAEAGVRVSPWSNWQTFILSGARDCEANAEDLLPAALRNLERCDFVGVSETLDADLKTLAAIRGWPDPAGPTARANVTPGRPRLEDLPADLLARLRAVNACDARLFARAVELRAAFRAEVRPPVWARPVAPSTARSEHGTRDITLTSARVRRVGEGGADDIVRCGDRVRIELQCHSAVDATDVAVGIRLTDALGIEVYGVNSALIGRTLTVTRGETFRLDYTFAMTLAPGQYRLTVAIHQADSHLNTCYHWIDNALMFACQPRGQMLFSGIADLGASMVVSRQKPPARAAPAPLG